MFQIGSQIAYVPSHVYGDITNPDVIFGFVTYITGPIATSGPIAICRYWRKGVDLSKIETIEEAYEALRTKANGERTDLSDLIIYPLVRNSIIKGLMDLLS